MFLLLLYERLVILDKCTIGQNIVQISFMAFSIYALVETVWMHNNLNTVNG